MVGVDAGAWIDVFNGAPSPALATLRRLRAEGDAETIVPDLVLCEVLPGLRDERQFLQARQLMGARTPADTGGADLARRAARPHRHLRAAGTSVRSALPGLQAWRP